MKNMKKPKDDPKISKMPLVYSNELAAKQIQGSLDLLMVAPITKRHKSKIGKELIKALNCIGGCNYIILSPFKI